MTLPTALRDVARFPKMVEYVFWGEAVAVEIWHPRKPNSTMEIETGRMKRGEDAVTVRTEGPSYAELLRSVKETLMENTAFERRDQECP